MTATTPFVDPGAATERRSDLPALTGMRFFAALLVFMSHVAFPLYPGNQNPALPFSDQGLATGFMTFTGPGGYIGVSFFFILSGFVITWAARPGMRTRGYLRRRIVKIFPNHIVTWALAMVLFAAASTPANGLPSLFLVNTWTTDSGYWGGANMPAWSLTSEILFYLLFPLLIIPIRRIADNRLWVSAAVAIAGMYAICLATLYLVPDTPAIPGGGLSLTQFWFIYVFPPVRLLEFVFGMILARIVMRGLWPKRIGYTPVVILLALAYWGTLELPSPYNMTLVTAIPFGLAIGTFAAANVRGERTVLGSRPMVWLGNISFGFFMTQAIVLFWLRPAVLGNDSYGLWGGVALIVALTAANILAGWLLFKFVEQPAMRYLSRPRGSASAPPRVREPVGAASAAPPVREPVGAPAGHTATDPKDPDLV
ncbi:acyltransferase family protein [Nonomuraea insulae]|uniref:Acyltransferase family protein n=1 Tax=Nonomuraea insulae TaxID=1616787 RepID=A0ABW1CCJ1_9ACTN